MRGRWPLRTTGQQRSVDGDDDGDGDDHGHDGHAGPPEAHREGFGHALRGLRVADDGGVALAIVRIREAVERKAEVRVRAATRVQV